MRDNTVCAFKVNVVFREDSTMSQHYCRTDSSREKGNAKVIDLILLDICGLIFFVFAWGEWVLSKAYYTRDLQMSLDLVKCDS